MSLDQRIKNELESDSEQIDRIVADEKGLFGMLSDSFTGSMGPWVWIATVMALALSALIVWAGYGFFTAADVDERVFWGVIAAVALFAQAAVKLYIFMDMHRASLMREIKRLEVAVARLRQA